MGNHPVLQGYLSAFREHRPVTISPDIIWLLVVQGLSHHLSNKAEELRSMFVSFDGQKELTVKRLDMNYFTATADDWAREIFPDFASQVAEHTSQDLLTTLTPSFTTTTPASLAAAQISVMAVVHHYFIEHVWMGGCGFPSVTIEGTVEDWQSVLEKVNNIEKFNLDWWVAELRPIITEIIKTKSGEFNRDFWLGMMRYHLGYGFDAYNPTYIDGWICKFFPYTSNGKDRRTSSGQFERIYDVDDLPHEMLTVPFKMHVLDHGGERQFDAEFVAGFVGLSQDHRTLSVKPEIGWLVKEGRTPPPPNKS
jgi:hypothetical protein